MASAFQTTAEAIIAVFEDEFSAEGFKMIPDRLHESLGRYRVDVGISPEETRPNVRTAITNETRVLVQFYDLWTDEIEPTTQVNPYKIAGYATRFADALRRAQEVYFGSPRVWFFTVESIEYPNDPTGNKSRFHMWIRAWGNNDNLVETSA